jgi:hypothetical protein
MDRRDNANTVVAFYNSVNMPKNYPWGKLYSTIKGYESTHTANIQMTIHTDVFEAVRNEKQGLFHT